MDYSPEELGFALVARLTIDEKNDLASVSDDITKNPDRIAVIQNALFWKNNEKILDQDHAVAFYISLNLSTWKYLCLRNVLADYGVPVLPSYYKRL